MTCRERRTLENEGTKRFSSSYARLPVKPDLTARMYAGKDNSPRKSREKSDSIPSPYRVSPCSAPKLLQVQDNRCRETHASAFYKNEAFVKFLERVS